MNLIQEYVALTKVCANTDYAVSKSVQVHNRSVRRMAEIAHKIGHEQTAETMADFAKLLDIDENSTNLWTAIHILDSRKADKTMEEKSLDIIQQHAAGDSLEAMGFKIWLDNYKKNKTQSK